MTDGTARVLVVEDDDILRELLTLLLEIEGFEVLPAGNGAQGLEILQRTAVDVVVLDLMMPVMDGFAFMQAIADHNPRPRVIVLSAAAGGEQAAELQHAGIDAAVRKPVDFKELLAHLRSLSGGAA